MDVAAFAELDAVEVAALLPLGLRDLSRRSVMRALIFLHLASSGTDSPTVKASISFTIATIISPCTRSCRRTPSMKRSQFVFTGSASFASARGRA